MRTEYINPFLTAAIDVLSHELGAPVTRGQIFQNQSPRTSQDVTVLIGVTGAVKGTVLLCLSQDVARGMVAKILGQPFPEFDELAQSGTAELGNIITGTAGARLADAGYVVTISPPTVIVGRDLLVSTLSLPRIVIPVDTCAGSIEIHVALQG